MAELQRFLEENDADTKSAAKEWGRQAVTSVIQQVVSHFECPIGLVKVQVKPRRTARKGRRQTALGFVQAGGATVAVHIDADDTGRSWQFWLRARVDPATRDEGWIYENREYVEGLVKKYSSGGPLEHLRQERKGQLRPIESATWLVFTWSFDEIDAGELVVRDDALAEFAADFDGLIGGVMRETLKRRQQRYQALRALIPVTDFDQSDAGGTTSWILERATVVRALLAALNRRPMVLLAGVSGTGKTQLAKRIGLARALGFLDEVDEESEGSLVDRQFRALVGPVIEPIADSEWVKVRQPEEPTESSGGNESEDDASSRGGGIGDDDGDDGDDDEDEGDDDDEEDSEGDELDDVQLDVRDRFALVPVQADWKEAASLWGWYHPLGEGAFHASQVLRVFLDAAERARANLPVGHTVVLDEMNLSRIEHYGSDLLSAMENPGREMISLHRVGEAVPMSGNGGMLVPPATMWPKGLVVIGTVNVDETTFSFAPKVLDRAAVLEFVDVELELYFKEMGQEGVWTKLGPWFEAVQKVTQPYNLHLGYRAAQEIVAVLQAQLGDEAGSWTTERLKPLLDAQLRNKVLPRVRGPRGSAEPVLLALLALALTGPEGIEAETRRLEELSQAGWPPTQTDELRTKLGRGSAAEKAWQMLQRLRDIGFTGFF
ncbi:MAG: hypothetical protein R3B72_38120 [Polyangiaceae bacterium]